VQYLDKVKKHLLVATGICTACIAR